MVRVAGLCRVLFLNSVYGVYDFLNVFWEEFVFVAYFIKGYIVLFSFKYIVLFSFSFVSILFSLCASVCSGVFVSVCSISFAKSSQFAFSLVCVCFEELVYCVMCFAVEGSDYRQVV